MVENVRVGRRVFQRQALYLGELNDSQREEWQRAIAREHAPGLTPRQIIDKFRAVKTCEQNPSNRWDFARERGKSG